MFGPNETNRSQYFEVQDAQNSRAKRLHWTSCLKIAEDVAQGLYHIHQTSSALVHIVCEWVI